MFGVGQLMVIIAIKLANKTISPGFSARYYHWKPFLSRIGLKLNVFVLFSLSNSKLQVPGIQQNRLIISRRRITASHHLFRFSGSMANAKGYAIKPGLNNFLDTCTK